MALDTYGEGLKLVEMGGKTPQSQKIVVKQGKSHEAYFLRGDMHPQVGGGTMRFSSLVSGISYYCQWTDTCTAYKRLTITALSLEYAYQLNSWSACSPHWW
jgi:hypothetical protein